MIRAVFSVFMPVALAWFHSAARAEGTLDVAALLAKESIPARTTLDEVRRFTGSKILPMPTPKSKEEWTRYADAMRRETLENVVFRGEAAKWRDAKTKVEMLDKIEGGPGYSIQKLRYEALPGLWIPALLYLPEKLEGKAPVFLNVNGHDGVGKAAVYKQTRCINQAKRGIIALNVEWLGMGQLNAPGYMHYRMNQLDLCGTSGLAPFYLAMSRGIDLLLALPNADPARVGVAGLSGGGWQTITISSLDTRVTLSNPVAGYSSFKTRVDNFSDLGDSEQTPNDLGAFTDYAHMTAMLAPRPILLTYNDKDNCCFATGHALPPLLEAAGPIFDLYGARAKLRSHTNSDPGTHNFEIDNRQALYRVIGEEWFAGDAKFDPKEITCDKEIKTKEQLDVPLPAPNHDFNTLAKEIAKSVPRRTASAAPDIARLRSIVQLKDYSLRVVESAPIEGASPPATRWILLAGGEWTIPAVEFTPDATKAMAPEAAPSPSAPTVVVSSRRRGLFGRFRRRGACEVVCSGPSSDSASLGPETTIVIADGGKKTAAAAVSDLLKTTPRVVAVDPFYFGEAKIAEKDFLFALMVATVGERPLGIQAGQLIAVAKHCRNQTRRPVRIRAIGPRTSLIALVAAALEPNAIAGLELEGCYGTLKEIIEQNKGVNKAPELFCFGLLESFDIKDLVALVSPRPVQMIKP